MPPNFTYVTHARTLEELRSEFLSDLTRRLSDINSRKKIVTSPGDNKALSLIEAELASLLHFWQTIELSGTKAKRSSLRSDKEKEHQL